MTTNQLLWNLREKNHVHYHFDAEQRCMRVRLRLMKEEDEQAEEVAKWLDGYFHWMSSVEMIQNELILEEMWEMWDRKHNILVAMRLGEEERVCIDGKHMMIQ